MNSTFKEIHDLVYRFATIICHQFTKLKRWQCSQIVIYGNNCFNSYSNWPLNITPNIYSKYQTIVLIDTVRPSTNVRSYCTKRIPFYNSCKSIILTIFFNFVPKLYHFAKLPIQQNNLFMTTIISVLSDYFEIILWGTVLW